MVGKYKVIGICACEVHSEYPRNIILSICEKLKASDSAEYRVILFNSFNPMSDSDDAKGEASIFSLDDPELIDVMILLPESIKSRTVTESIINKMKSNNIPVICVDCFFEGCINVVFEYVNAFEKIVRHIIEDHGCKTVNFLAGIKGNEISDNREKCFRRVMEENNIEVEEERIDYGHFWYLPTENAMDRFMSSGLSMPEAIICANDSMAITVCKYLKQRGIKVPEDVIVTGFDGIEIERFNTPRLTTAHTDIEYAGNIVEKLVSSLIAGQKVDDVVTVPYKVRISQSCRCAPMNLAVTNDKIMDIYNMGKRSSVHEDFMFSYIEKATVCNDFNELADVMSTYSDYNFWCCLNKDFIKFDPDCSRYNDNYTEDMDLLVRRLNGTIIKNHSFKTKELLYELENAFEYFSAVMFCPLHFHAAVYGYIVSEIHMAHPFENTRRFLFNTNMILENFRQRKLLSIANSELDIMQMTDSMTGLYNRRGFYRNIKSLLNNKGQTQVIVFSVDLDNLKIINDSFGHKEGDRAINTVANALKKSAEGKDTVTARFGGDEFAVLMISDDPEGYVASIESTLADFNAASGLPYTVHASIGYSVINDCSHTDIDEHFKIADKKMYCSKMKYKSLIQN